MEYNYSYLINKIIGNQDLIIAKFDTLILYVSVLLFIIMVVFLYMFVRDLLGGHK